MTRRRRIRWASAVIAVGAGLITVWFLVTAVLAREQLGQARQEIGTLRTQLLAGKTADARTTARLIGEHTHRARRLTNLPGWAIAAGLPGIGAPLRTVRGITATTDTLMTATLPDLITLSAQLDPATLRAPGGRIALSRVIAIGPGLTHAEVAVSQATTAVRALPTTWLAPVNGGRNDLLTQLTGLDGDLRAANRAVRILPAMLGENGPKRYFVAFQNESEARGTGGLTGAFAIVRADHGLVKFEHFENTALSGVTAKLDFGPDYRQLYDGGNTMTLYGNANVSPNFPYAAQIWAAMWQNHSGQHLDGALAVDPTALSYLLAVTGPATMADGSQVNAANIVELTQNTVYTRFATSNNARRAFLLEVARAVSAKVLAAGSDAKGLVAAAARAVDERRLLVYSADPAIEAQLAPTAISGVIPDTPQPYVGLSVVNSGGNKLDYYLDRSLAWRRTGCGPTRAVTVTITLVNNAPTGLPAYVIGRSDLRGYPVRAGDNRLQVAYSATRGALMKSVSVNGAPSTASIGMERGHPVYTVDVELPRGASRTVVLHLSEPAATGQVSVLRQPLVRPLHVVLDDVPCG